jgi:hypothetical protein
MEAKEIKAGTYPGMQSLLSRTMNAVHGADHERLRRQPQACGIQQLPYFIALTGRAETQLYDFDPCVYEFKTFAQPDVQPLLDYALQRLPSVLTTADADKLARELYAMLPPDVQKQANEAAKGNMPGGKGKPSTDNDDPDRVQKPGTQPVSSEILERALQRLTDKMVASGSLQVNGNDPYNESKQLTRNKSPFRPAAMPGSRPANLLAQIDRLVYAPELLGHDRYQLTGRFDRRSMVRAGHQNNVFNRRTRVPGRNTAVHILTDGSSSMHGTTFESAIETAFWVAYAVDQAGVPVSASVFKNAELDSMLEFNDPVIYGRFRGATCYGSTPLAASMLIVGPELARTPADQHLLFVVTDGGCNSGSDNVRRTVNLLMEEYPSMIVAAIGLGVGASYVPQAFPYYQMLGSVNELKTRGLPFLVDLLERECIAS